MVGDEIDPLAKYRMSHSKIGCLNPLEVPKRLRKIFERERMRWCITKEDLRKGKFNRDRRYLFTAYYPNGASEVAEVNLLDVEYVPTNKKDVFRVHMCEIGDESTFSEMSIGYSEWWFLEEV